MSAAVRAIAKLRALQEAGEIPQGFIRRAFFGTEKVTPGLTQGSPLAPNKIDLMPLSVLNLAPKDRVKVVKELKKLEKIISSAQKGKGGKATQDLKDIIRSLESKKTGSVAGQGKTPLKLEDLSKKEIQEAIKEGFPLTPAPPKGAVASFGDTKLRYRKSQQPKREPKPLEDITAGQERAGRQPLSESSVEAPFLVGGQRALIRPTEAREKAKEAAKGLSRTEDYDVRPSDKLGASKPQEASEEAMDYFRTGEGQAEIPSLDLMARTLHFSDKEVFDQLMSEFKKQGLNPAQEQFIFSRLLDLSGNARLRKDTFDKLEGINAASAREARRFSDARTVKERRKKDDEFIYEDVDDAVGTDKPLQDDFAEVGDYFSGTEKINLKPDQMQGLVAAGREGMGTFDSAVRAEVISSIMREIPSELRGNLFNTLMSPVETRQTQFLRSLLGKADEQGTLAFTLTKEDLQKLPRQLKGFVKPSKGGTMLDVPVADLGARKLLLREIPTIKRSLNLTQEFSPKRVKSLRLAASDAQRGKLIMPGLGDPSMATPVNQMLPRAEDLMSGERLVEFQKHLGMLGKMGN